MENRYTKEKRAEQVIDSLSTLRKILEKHPDSVEARREYLELICYLSINNLLLDKVISIVEYENEINSKWKKISFSDVSKMLEEIARNTQVPPKYLK